MATAQQTSAQASALPCPPPVELSSVCRGKLNTGTQLRLLCHAFEGRKLVDGVTMRPTLMWLRLRNTPILQQLRLEEALYRADTRSWFITNEWDQAAKAAEAIVLGISGKVDEMVHTAEVAHAEVPVLKRFTGGGTVIVDSDTMFVSFLIGTGALPSVAPYPEPILQWTSGIYADALRRCGAAGFRVNANDYCLGQLKFGGNAQVLPTLHPRPDPMPSIPILVNHIS